MHVYWTRARSVVPEGPSYSAVARFAEDRDTWPADAWSIVLQYRPEQLNEIPVSACAEFLSPDAPVARLAAGRTFELLEGNVVVGIAIVVDGSEAEAVDQPFRPANPPA